MRTRPLKKVKDLTVREHFAGIALQGMLANTNFNPEYTDNLVELSVKIADKLIEELNKTDNEPHS